MTAPRIKIDLHKIRDNTRCLVERLKPLGITVTGVTKGVCGHPGVARAMLDGGAIGLADARLANVRRMRKAGLTCPILMIRTPMLSQAGQIVETCEASCNTETSVIAKLAAAALRRGISHEIILMVEMGDRREGIMPEDLTNAALHVTRTPGVLLKGIGANFACLADAAPTSQAMAVLSSLADETEGACGPFVETVSGGSSANLSWALDGGPADRINNLRIGEAILLGTDPVSGHPISGLHTDAFTLLAEVIETKIKSKPVPLKLSDPALSALSLVPGNHWITRSILALGLQDTDPAGLTFPAAVIFAGATSDHIVVETTNCPLRIGSEMSMKMSYSALARAMEAPDVSKVLHRNRPLTEGAAGSRNGRITELF
ncbi:alanine/ornithine racemase family PLP-dependent enzyme [Phaeobacter inhibens]|uniref:alanine/ornithine racemase family PLP-dependent enzyme n=1 Tax=Phaeobacter inhibens TaxID=221822 RepID=UPI0021A32BBC|nr:alanine/ornithine racemase family PLP-dependent enzyme [Phaeobacter inhibens]UWR47927.1 alanine/ornithine racemase family PLP-dependent enzyme [Phaeobacter inhibens]